MSAKPDTWMPMYWGDYLRDTMHLRAEGHGAYMLLIAAYWCNGAPLPDNDEYLSAVAKMEPKAWQKLKPVLGNFFEVANGEWRHSRIDREIERAKHISNVRQEAGKRGGKAKANAMNLPEQNTKQNPRQSQPQSQEVRTPPIPTGSSPPKEPTDGKSRRAKKPATAMPADWQPDAGNFAVGEAEGYTRAEIEWLAGGFRSSAEAHDYRYVRWSAAFSNWLKSDITRRQIEGRRKSARHGIPGNPSAHRGLATAILEAGAAIQRNDRGSHPGGLHGEGDAGGYGEGQSGFGEPMPTTGDSRTIDGICEAGDPDDAETGRGIDVGGGVPGTPSNGTGGRGAVRAEKMAGDAEREVVPDVARTEGHDRHSGGTAAEDVGSPDDLTKRPDCLRRTA